MDALINTNRAERLLFSLCVAMRICAKLGKLSSNVCSADEATIHLFELGTSRFTSRIRRTVPQKLAVRPNKQRNRCGLLSALR